MHSRCIDSRGLISGLESVIKVVTGNSDDADGQRININLKTVAKNELNIINKIDKQEIINNDIKSRDN